MSESVEEVTINSTSFKCGDTITQHKVQILSGLTQELCSERKALISIQKLHDSLQGQIREKNRLLAENDDLICNLRSAEASDVLKLREDHRRSVQEKQQYVAKMNERIREMDERQVQLETENLELRDAEADLRMQVARLQTDTSRLQKELQTFRSDDSVQLEISELHVQIATRSGHTKDLQQKVEELTKELEESRLVGEQQHTMFEGLQKILNCVSEVNTQLWSKVEDSAQAPSVTEPPSVSMDVWSDDMTLADPSTRNLYKVATTKILPSPAVLSNIWRLLAKKNDNITSLEATCKDASKRANELQQQMTVVKAENMKLVAELEFLKNDSDMLAKQKSELLEKNSKLENECKRGNNTKTDAIQKLQLILQRLQQKISTNHTLLCKWIQQHKDLYDEISTPTSPNTRCESPDTILPGVELPTVVDELHTMLELVEIQEPIFVCLDKIVETKQTAIQKLEDDVKQLQQRNHKLQDALVEAENSCGSTEKVRTELQKQIILLQETVEHHEMELQSKCNVILDLKEENAKLDRELQRMEEESGASMNQLARIRQETQELEDTCKTLQQDVISKGDVDTELKQKLISITKQLHQRITTNHKALAAWINGHTGGNYNLVLPTPHLNVDETECSIAKAIDDLQALLGIIQLQDPIMVSLNSVVEKRNLVIEESARAEQQLRSTLSSVQDTAEKYHRSLKETQERCNSLESQRNDLLRELEMNQRQELNLQSEIDKAAAETEELQRQVDSLAKDSAAIASTKQAVHTDLVKWTDCCEQLCRLLQNSVGQHSKVVETLASKEPSFVSTPILDTVKLTPTRSPAKRRLSTPSKSPKRFKIPNFSSFTDEQLDPLHSIHSVMETIEALTAPLNKLTSHLQLRDTMISEQQERLYEFELMATQRVQMQSSLLAGEEREEKLQKEIQQLLDTLQKSNRSKDDLRREIESLTVKSQELSAELDASLVKRGESWNSIMKEFWEMSTSNENDVLTCSGVNIDFEERVSPVPSPSDPVWMTLMERCKRKMGEIYNLSKYKGEISILLANRDNTIQELQHKINKLTSVNKSLEEDKACAQQEYDKCFRKQQGKDLIEHSAINALQGATSQFSCLVTKLYQTVNTTRAAVSNILDDSRLRDDQFGKDDLQIVDDGTAISSVIGNLEMEISRLADVYSVTTTTMDAMLDVRSVYTTNVLAVQDVQQALDNAKTQHIAEVSKLHAEIQALEGDKETELNRATTTVLELRDTQEELNRIKAEIQHKAGNLLQLILSLECSLSHQLVTCKSLAEDNSIKIRGIEQLEIEINDATSVNSQSARNLALSQQLDNNVSRLDHCVSFSDQLVAIMNVFRDTFTDVSVKITEYQRNGTAHTQMLEMQEKEINKLQQDNQHLTVKLMEHETSLDHVIQDNTKQWSAQHNNLQLIQQNISLVENILNSRIDSLNNLLIQYQKDHNIASPSTNTSVALLSPLPKRSLPELPEKVTFSANGKTIDAQSYHMVLNSEISRLDSIAGKLEAVSNMETSLKAILLDKDFTITEMKRKDCEHNEQIHQHAKDMLELQQIVQQKTEEVSKLQDRVDQSTTEADKSVIEKEHQASDVVSKIQQLQRLNREMEESLFRRDKMLSVLLADLLNGSPQVLRTLVSYQLQGDTTFEYEVTRLGNNIPKVEDIHHYCNELRRLFGDKETEIKKYRSELQAISRTVRQKSRSPPPPVNTDNGKQKEMQGIVNDEAYFRKKLIQMEEEEFNILGIDEHYGLNLVKQADIQRTKDFDTWIQYMCHEEESIRTQIVTNENEQFSQISKGFQSSTSFYTQIFPTPSKQQSTELTSHKRLIERDERTYRKLLERVEQQEFAGIGVECDLHYQSLVHYKKRDALSKCAFIGIEITEGVMIDTNRDGHVDALVTKEGYERKGVKVLHVKGPAEKCGLKVGDIITDIDGGQTNSLASFKEAAARIKPGQSIQVHVQRNAKSLTIKIQTEKRNRNEFNPGARHTHKVYLNLDHPGRDPSPAIVPAGSEHRDNTTSHTSHSVHAHTRPTSPAHSGPVAPQHPTPPTTTAPTTPPPQAHGTYHTLSNIGGKRSDPVHREREREREREKDRDLVNVANTAPIPAQSSSHIIHRHQEHHFMQHIVKHETTTTNLAFSSTLNSTGGGGGGNRQSPLTRERGDSVTPPLPPLSARGRSEFEKNDTQQARSHSQPGYQAHTASSYQRMKEGGIIRTNPHAPSQLVFKKEETSYSSLVHTCTTTSKTSTPTEELLQTGSVPLEGRP